MLTTEELLSCEDLAAKVSDLPVPLHCGFQFQVITHSEVDLRPRGLENDWDLAVAWRAVFKGEQYGNWIGVKEWDPQEVAVAMSLLLMNFWETVDALGIPRGEVA